MGTAAALALLLATACTGAASAHGARAMPLHLRGSLAGPRGRAEGGRWLDGTDTAHLRLLRQDEALLYEEGPVAGALPGRMIARLLVGSTFTGSCTIYTRYGSIGGRGRAIAHGAGRYQSFSGTFTVTGGSGRYRHVHGTTRLYGTFDRRTFAVVVQTVGRLSY